MGDHPVLIDSHTGQSFSQAKLDATIAQWGARIRADIPKFFDGAEALDKAAQKERGVGGWYAYVPMDKCAATVIACMTTAALHGAYVLSDFDDRKSIVDRVRPVLAFVDKADPVPMPGEFVYRVIVDADKSEIVDVIAPSNTEPAAYAPERAIDADVRYITFSSGSTGRPKGIYGSDFCVNHMNEERNRLYPYPTGADKLPKENNGQPWTVGVNIFLLWECFRPLAFGATCVIIRQDTFIDPDALLAIVDKYHVNELLFTASYAKLFLSHHLMKSADLQGKKVTAPPCLRRLWQNGEPVTAALRQSFLDYCSHDDTVEILNLYSISECYEVGHGNIRGSRTELVTFPGVNVTFDPDNKSEVVVRTPTIRHGYHKPSTDAEKNAFAADHSFYRTGDVGKLLREENGKQYFELSGRCSNFIRVKGRFLSLEQVEDVVERGLKLAGKGLATVEVDADTSELVAYVDGGFDSELLPDVRALCPFPEWMPDRFVRHAPTVRRPSPSGKSSPAYSSGKADGGGFPTQTPRVDIKKVLLDHVGFDVDTLSKAMSLRDLGISSLSILRLREALKTEAGVDMSVGELYKIADVRKFVAETFTPDMLHEEHSLVVTSTVNSPGFDGDVATAPEPKSYFVTGATGFLGGWVVNAIAERQPDAEVFILSRRSDEQTREVFAKKGLKLPAQARIVKGDTSQPGFGMDADVIKQIQQRVRYFVHCAAHVVFGCSYAEARPATVMGANHLLVLYLGSHPKAELHYVSTNGVYPPHFTRDTRRACLESQDDFELYASRLKEGYGWSKWVAERAVVDVCEKRDRRVRVYRPGNIGWALDGRYNPIDFQTLIVFACRALNAVPAMPTWNFEMTPVSLLAEFMVGNFDKATADGKAGIHNVIGKRTVMDFYIDAAIPRVELSDWLEAAENFVEKKDEVTGPNAARDLDAVEQTRASFDEFVTLDMYLSDTNDYFTHNSLAYEPTREFAASIQ